MAAGSVQGQICILAEPSPLQKKKKKKCIPGGLHVHATIQVDFVLNNG